jgi:phospholipid/cholesterol/gamma-HCH transport system permease protein
MAVTTPTGRGVRDKQEPQPVAAPAARDDGAFVGGIRELGELMIMIGQSLAALIFTPRYLSEILRSASSMIRRTSLLMFVMNGFLGMSIVNAAYFFLRGIGASDFLGTISGYAVPRILAVLMFGYVFTAAVCCAIAAEIGAMKINQEVDAYESTGVDPLRYLVGTRFIGMLIFLPLGVLLALLGELAGTYLNSVIILKGIGGAQLLDLHWSVQTVSDQIYAFTTMAAIATITTLVACFYGLRTRGGPAAVGEAVARSLLVNLVIVHVIAAAFAVLYYSGNLALPIGG